jgi:hypothetical protein
MINQLKLVPLIENVIRLATTWLSTLKTSSTCQKIDKPPTCNIGEVGWSREHLRILYYSFKSQGSR